MKRKAETRAANAADRMAALLEDLRPVLDAYRCGTHATEEDAREAFDLACADACACIEGGWTVGNLDEVLLTDPGFRCFKGRLAPSEAHILRGVVYGVQAEARQLVGALRTYKRHRAADFMDSTVEELRRLLVQEDAGAARGPDGSMTTAEIGACEAVRRRGRPPKPGGAKGYAPNEDRLLAAVRIVETLRAGKAGTLGEAIGYCITHGEEEIRAKCKAFNDDGTTLKRWAKFNRTTVTELLGLSAEEWTERKGTLK